MFRLAFLSFLLLANLSYSQAPQEVLPQADGGYVVNGHIYNLAPGNWQIAGKIYRFLPKPETPPKSETPPKPETPLAPKDPEETLPPKTTPKSPHTKDEIVKSIQNNTTIPDNVKKEILKDLKPDQLSQKTPIISLTDNSLLPIPSSSRSKEQPFDLVNAIRAQNSQQAVKAYTEETPPIKTGSPPTRLVEPKEPKKDFVLLPSTAIAENDALELPVTEIGVSLGSKIDYSTPWDISKPVPFGKMIQCWVKPVARRPDKLKTVAYTWTILPKEESILWPDTTRIILSSGNKAQNYVIILTASYVYADGDKIVQKASQAITIIQVNDGSAGGTTITPPSGLTGAAKLAYEWTTGIVRTAEYTNELFKADALKLAQAYRKVANKVKGAELTDINDILETVKTENRNVLKTSQVLWHSWLEQFTELLRAGYRDNTIRTPQQYQQLLEDLASGLEKVGG